MREEGLTGLLHQLNRQRTVLLRNVRRELLADVLRQPLLQPYIILDEYQAPFLLV